MINVIQLRYVDGVWQCYSCNQVFDNQEHSCEGTMQHLECTTCGEHLDTDNEGLVKAFHANHERHASEIARAVFDNEGQIIGGVPIADPNRESGVWGVMGSLRTMTPAEAHAAAPMKGITDMPPAELNNLLELYQASLVTVPPSTPYEAPNTRDNPRETTLKHLRGLLKHHEDSGKFLRRAIEVIEEYH